MVHLFTLHSLWGNPAFENEIPELPTTLGGENIKKTWPTKSCVRHRTNSAHYDVAIEYLNVGNQTFSTNHLEMVVLCCGKLQSGSIGTKFCDA